MGAERPKPIHVFISYAHEDEALKDELLKHLAPLRRSGAITTWHDRDLNPGDPLPQTEAELDQADLVLLLLSIDYLASDQLHDREMKRALDRHAGGHAKVIPILLRPIAIEQDTPFASLTMLPKDRRPVASWSSRDEAWNDVVRGVRRALGLPAAEEEEEPEPASSGRHGAISARVELAKSRDRMIIIVVAIVAVTIIFVRTSGAPTAFLLAIGGLAFIGVSGSVVRHALRSRKLAVAGAAAVAGAVVVGASKDALASSAFTGASAGTSQAPVAVSAGSAFGPLVSAAAIGIAAAGAGVGIGLGVEAAVSAVDKRALAPSTPPRLKPPFDGLSSLLAADAGSDADAGADEDAGADDDAGGEEEDAGAIDAGADGSASHRPDSTGSVDRATFERNAAIAVGEAKKEAKSCLRASVTCSGRVTFTPEGTVGSQSITCAPSGGRADTEINRCVRAVFQKRRIPPLNKLSGSTGADVPVGAFSK